MISKKQGWGTISLAIPFLSFMACGSDEGSSGKEKKVGFAAKSLGQGDSSPQQQGSPFVSALMDEIVHTLVRGDITGNTKESFWLTGSNKPQSQDSSETKTVCVADAQPGTASVQSTFNGLWTSLINLKNVKNAVSVVGVGSQTKIWRKDAKVVTCESDGKRAKLPIDELTGLELDWTFTRRKEKTLSAKVLQPASSGLENSKLLSRGSRTVIWESLSTAPTLALTNKDHHQKPKNDSEQNPKPKPTIKPPPQTEPTADPKPTEAVKYKYRRQISAQARIDLELVPPAQLTQNFEIRSRNVPGTTLKVVTERDASLGYIRHTIETGTLEGTTAENGKLTLTLKDVEYRKGNGCRPVKGEISGSWVVSETSPPIGFRVSFGEDTTSLVFADGSVIPWTPAGCDLEDPLN
jgi:hypothetical protein